MKKKILIFGLVGESVFLSTDHFHNDGETVVVDEIHNELGGKGFNQALTINALNHNVTFIGVVGSDYYGKFCEEYLNDLHINHHLIIKCGKTAYATILTNKNGDNQVSVYPGVNELFDKEDVKKYEYEFKTSEYVLITAELPYEVIKKIITLSKKYNVKVIFNPAPAKSFVKDIINDVWLITPNYQEALTILGIQSSTIEEFKESLLKSNLNNILVTMGKYGALLKEDGQIKQILSKEVEVKDTTGAGDIFNGTLCSYLLDGKSLIEAVELSCEVASYSTSVKYVIPSINEISKWRKENE